MLSTVNITYSLFNGIKDNKPEQVTSTLIEFVNKRLRKPFVRPNKDGMAWSPTAYAEGMTRGNKNVQMITAAVFDVDNGTPTSYFSEKLSGCAHVIHSSYSHTADHPKYRVVLFLSAPVPAELWPTMWERLAAWVGGNIDPQTKDLARVYYLPSHPPGSEPIFELHEGGLFRMEQLPEVPSSYVSATAKTSKARAKLDDVYAVDGMYAEDGLEIVVDRCHLVRKCAEPENQNNVSEPLWRAMLSNLARLKGGRNFAHQASEHYDNYSEEETDEYLERHFTEVGPLTCQHIREQGWEGCPRAGNCVAPNGSPVLAPIQLRLWGQIPMKKVPQPVVAHALVDRYYPHGIVYVQESYWGYRQGAYQMLNQRYGINKPLLKILGDGATSMLTKSIDEILKNQVAAEPDVFSANSHLLCLKNGTLNLMIGTLEPHDPGHMLQNKVNIDFDPAAGCPKFMAFLQAIFEPDEDKVEKIDFLRQWLGYLLTPDTSHQKMVWLIGGGGNGKSVLLQVVEWLVGTANISHAMLDRLERPIVRAELVGKTLNISADLPKDAMINDGYIKAIVAGDVIEAEYKYKPSFSFKPKVRLMAAMNNLPKTNDTSDGFFRRTVILTFNRKFTEQEQNPDLAQELHAELSGILNWALAGLAELKSKGAFTIPPSSGKALSVYRVESNPVQLFAQACLVTTESRGLVPRDLYPIYVQWASDNGFRKMSSVTFGRALSELGFSRGRSGGRDYWKIRLNDEGESLRVKAGGSSVSGLEDLASVSPVSAQAYIL